MNPILVWKFHDAPEEYKKLSDNGGDEDWLVYVPATYNQSDDWHLRFWIDRMSAGEADIHVLPDGARVFIAAH